MTDAPDLRLKMQDPRTQYPQPPFKRQPQEAPGLSVRWSRSPTMGKPATEVTDAWKGGRPS